MPGNGRFRVERTQAGFEPVAAAQHRFLARCHHAGGGASGRDQPCGQVACADVLGQRLRHVALYFDGQLIVSPHGSSSVFAAAHSSIGLTRPMRYARLAQAIRPASQLLHESASRLRRSLPWLRDQGENPLEQAPLASSFWREGNAHPRRRAAGARSGVALSMRGAVVMTGISVRFWSRCHCGWR